MHFCSMAEDVKFTLVLSSSSISLQDLLQVQYTIENSHQVSQFVPPFFKGFNVMEGPEQASGWSLENGVLKEYITFSFVLKPARQGHIMIPSAMVKIDGKTYRSNNAWVDISSSVVPGQVEDKSQINDFIMKPGEDLAKKISNNIFVRLDVNKYSCFEGEPLVATYKLYTRLKSESKVTKRPSFNGFSVYDMADPETEEAGREIYKGKEYNVYLLRKVQLYPLQSGKFDLDPVEVENNLTFIRAESIESKSGLSGLLQSLTSDNIIHEGIVREKVTLASNQVTIEVKPLPENKPVTFEGAVGRFRIHSSIPTGPVRKNDVINLQVEVSGKGNFPMMSLPAIHWPDSTEAFESTVNEQFNRFICPISGSKIFTYPFAVKKEGEIIIPAVSLSYFDPETAKYAIASTDSITLHVEQAKSAEISQVNLPIKDQPANTWKWIITAAGLIIVFGGLYLLLVQSRAQTPVIPAINGPAENEKNAEEGSFPIAENDPVKKIREAFDKSDYRQFYKFLDLVIDEWLMKKYRAEGTSNWQLTLSKNGVDPSVIRQVENLKNDAALAMYTPFVMESKMIEDMAAIDKLTG